MDHKTFFEQHGEYTLASRYFECTRAFTVEQLYQAIKQRLIEEVHTVLYRKETPTGDIIAYGPLASRTEEGKHEA